MIVNHTVGSEPAETDRMFLILDFELRNTSPTRSSVMFDPQAAMIRLHQSNGIEPELIQCDEVTEHIQRGFKGEVELTEQETKRGVIVFRIPAGVSACQFEYAGYRTDVTLGF
ncbi:hypothetical protein C2W62_04190 [Candidatus Entotheonella serta]|nr:hypothetical protein C2W62_04190 [Candidatus Entotheonella serta]